MPPSTRRSSARLTGAPPSSSPSQEATGKDVGSAKKRKADENDSSRSEKKVKEHRAEQQTLEKAIGADTDSGIPKQNGDADKNDSHGVNAQGPAKSENQSADANDNKAKTEEDEDQAKSTTVDPSDGAIEHSSQREKALPSNILEKGILYFFSRARVGLEQPTSVQEIARSYFVLRPLPAGAKLGSGALEDLKNNRLVAIPKKVLPKSGQDRFMVFIEKQGVTIEDLKSNFMQGSTYETQTQGQRSVPPVTPIAEGVYAITTTGRESHLAYMLTIPSELGEVQKNLGLSDKGSFILSTKNPETSGPSQAQFDNPAKFSKDIMDAFASRRWMPTEPSHLNYDSAQFLLIGEAQGDLGKATQANESDEKSPEKKTPEEELDLLEDEDLKRVKGLQGDDSIFADLGISKKEFPQVQSTW